MSVTVVIPAYNAATYLDDAIESVAAQTIADWELVVVDDGSTDGTNEVARAWAAKDPRVRVVSQENRGVSAARNRGMAHSSPEFEFVAFLDHDDVLEPTALEELSDALRAHPSAPAVHALRQTFHASDGGGWNKGRIWPQRRRGVVGRWLVRWPEDAPTAFAVLAYANVVPLSATLTRRRAVEEVGGFDPELSASEDWEFWLRLSRLGPIPIVNRPLVRYRRHATNVTRDRRRMFEGSRAARRKVLAAKDLTAEERQMLRRGYNFYQLYRIRESAREVGRAIRRGRFRQALTHADWIAKHLRGWTRGLG